MDFNPLAPHGARHLYPGKPMISVRFQSTSSSRSQTAMLIHDDRQLHLFQSTSSSRSQTNNYFINLSDKQFQSTSSSRSQTIFILMRMESVLFQSTSSSRSQTYYWITSIVSVGFQSTSSSRSQTRIPMVGVNYWLFQSTSSSRSQTVVYLGLVIPMEYFNPLAPHGARQGWICKYGWTDDISIH